MGCIIYENLWEKDKHENENQEMIYMDKILNKIMRFISENDDNMDEEESEVIRYGLEILLIKISFFTAALIIGAIMQSFLECLIFITLFSLIRTTAGGYHAETRMQCFISSMSIFAVSLGIIKLVSTYGYILIPLSILSVLSILIIWRLAPVDTENKRLDATEKQKFQKRTRVIILIEILIAVTTYLMNIESVAAAAMLALIITSVLVLTGLLKNKKERSKYE